MELELISQGEYDMTILGISKRLRFYYFNLYPPVDYHEPTKLLVALHTETNSYWWELEQNILEQHTWTKNTYPYLSELNLSLENWLQPEIDNLNSSKEDNVNSNKLRTKKIDYLSNF